jgi:hypothetical protein
LGDDLGTLIDNIHNAPAGLVPMMTWRADFFDDTDDALPSRSAIIWADSEDDAVDKAAAQIGDAIRIEFTLVISRGN